MVVKAFMLYCIYNNGHFDDKSDEIAVIYMLNILLFVDQSIKIPFIFTTFFFLKYRNFLNHNFC